MSQRVTSSTHLAPAPRRHHPYVRRSPPNSPPHGPLLSYHPPTGLSWRALDEAWRGRRAFPTRADASDDPFSRGDHHNIYGEYPYQSGEYRHTIRCAEEFARRPRALVWGRPVSRLSQLLSGVGRDGLTPVAFFNVPADSSTHPTEGEEHAGDPWNTRGAGQGGPPPPDNVSSTTDDTGSVVEEPVQMGDEEEEEEEDDLTPPISPDIEEEEEMNWTPRSSPATEDIEESDSDLSPPLSPGSEEDDDLTPPSSPDTEEEDEEDAVAAILMLSSDEDV